MPRPPTTAQVVSEHHATTINYSPGCVCTSCHDHQLQPRLCLHIMPRPSTTAQVVSEHHATTINYSLAQVVFEHHATTINYSLGCVCTSCHDHQLQPRLCLNIMPRPSTTAQVVSEHHATTVNYIEKENKQRIAACNIKYESELVRICPYPVY
ncbi:hypothetical protein Btru_077921 [Bulinus truncatus]|nr:hypothetical protein Btru_077921 [Bulinus truncatus]